MSSPPSLKTSPTPVCRPSRPSSRCARLEGHLHHAAPPSGEAVPPRRRHRRCAEFRVVEDLAGASEHAVAELGRPCVIKTAAFGYDGKGQCQVIGWTPIWPRPGRVSKAIEPSSNNGCRFVCEVSVVGARGIHGHTAAHGCVENQHDAPHPRCHHRPGPRRAARSSRRPLSSVESRRRGPRITSAPWRVEMFVTADGKVIGQRDRPVRHNSGHLHHRRLPHRTSSGQQQRAVCGLPLGDAYTAHARPSWSTSSAMSGRPELTHPDWSPVLSNHPRAKLHLYGERNCPQPRRKMGPLHRRSEYTIEEATQASARRSRRS